MDALQLRYNERKLSTLEAMKNLKKATGRKVWETTKDSQSLNAIRMALLRCHSQGHLNRRGGVYALFLFFLWVSQA